MKETVALLTLVLTVPCASIWQTWLENRSCRGQGPSWLELVAATNRSSSSTRIREHQMEWSLPTSSMMHSLTLQQIVLHFSDRCVPESALLYSRPVIRSHLVPSHSYQPGIAHVTAQHVCAVVLMHPRCSTHPGGAARASLLSKVATIITWRGAWAQVREIWLGTQQLSKPSSLVAYWPTATYAHCQVEVLTT